MSLLVAVVTRRTGVTLTLGSKTHHLVEVRPVGDWLERSWVEDVIVLDLETADATVEAIDHLRVMNAMRPLVIIAADGASWTGVTSLHPDLLIVPLPVTATTLLDTVDRAASLAVTGAASVRGAAGPAAPGVVSEREPVDAQGRPAPRVLEPAEPLTQPFDARPEGAAEDLLRDVASVQPTSFEVIAMVRSLLGEAGRLPRVADTAGVILSRATEASPADASAVLVPDEGVWRVEAGAGLRPLEERLQIDGTHWLVTETAVGRRGLLIKNTDVARNQLAGAPLASWANLLALPVSVDALVLMAREGTEFTRADLNRVAEAMSGIDGPMNEAIDVRRLARKMIAYLDLVD
jgi:hypothetical protein